MMTHLSDYISDCAFTGKTMLVVSRKIVKTLLLYHVQMTQKTKSWSNWLFSNSHS